MAVKKEDVLGRRLATVRGHLRKIDFLLKDIRILLGMNNPRLNRLLDEARAEIRKEEYKAKNLVSLYKRTDERDPKKGRRK